MTHGSATRNSRTILRPVARASSCRSKKSSGILAGSRLVRAHSWTSLHESLLLEPEQKIICPGMNAGKRWFVAQPDSMPAFLINVQIERHARLAQRGGEGERILHRHRCVFISVEEKTRRGFFGHLQFVGEQFHQFRRRVFSEQIVFGTL